MVENQTNRKIKRVVNDNGGEYVSNEFKEYLKTHGIIMDTTAPHTPEQNPISERGMRTTTERTRCLLDDSQLPLRFWGEAVATAVYLENRSPEASLGLKTPYELWYGEKPSLGHLRIFGCAAYRLIPKQFRESKFSRTSVKCILLGYQERISNYRLLDPSTGVIHYSHHVIFDETDFSHPSLRKDLDFSASLEEEPVIMSSGSDDFDPSSLHPAVSVYPASLPDLRSPGLTDMPSLVSGDPSVVLLDASSTSDVPVFPPVLVNPVEPADEPEAASNDIVAELPGDHPISEFLGGRGWSYEPASNIAPRDVSSVIDPSNILTGKRRRAMAAKTNSDAPRTFKQATQGHDRAAWLDAIETELKNMSINDVWDVVELPEGAKAIGTTWVYRVKTGVNGEFIKYKARLCAQGFTQIEGVDFKETYAPTGVKATLRVLLAKVAADDLELESMDAVAAFLNGVPDEVIYCRIPEGLDIPNRTSRTVLKLKRVLYGLKQSPRCWYRELTGFVTSINFSVSGGNPCLFISNDELNPCFVHAHVDDLTIGGTRRGVEAFKKAISEKFKMEDLGPTNSILGMKIVRNRKDHRLSISQEHTIETLLDFYGMSNCKSVATPFEAGTYLRTPTDDSIAKFKLTSHNYRSAVGSLNYLVQCTRPDLAFACSQLSQFLENPGQEHWAAFHRVLRYLRGTSHYAIHYQSHAAISGCSANNYVDADWAGCPESRRSTTGYVFCMYGGAISWKSTKQQVVSLSSTEAEYRATVDAAKELIWLQGICLDLKVNVPDVITLFNDNQGSISLAQNPVFHARTKHIEVHHYWIREKVEAKTFSISYIPTGDMIADLCTKSLERVLHERFCERLGLLVKKDT